MRSIRSMLYAFKQALKQIVRNSASSLTAVFIITAMLILLGGAFIGVANVNLAMEKAKQDYDQIQVYLLDDVSESDAMTIKNELSALPEVKEASYLSKDEAMEEWKQEWGDSAYLLDSLSSNPLPNSIVITVAELEYSDLVAEKAGKYTGVEDVIYYQDTVEKLAKVTDALQLAAMVIMGVLILVSVIVVSNTIKLTVFARADEISIMKFIGATNWFVRGPFLFEGIILGFISSMLAGGICIVLYDKLIELIGNDVFLMFKINLVPLSFLGINIILIFAALGVSVGACGSIISIRRFLKA